MSFVRSSEGKLFVLDIIGWKRVVSMPSSISRQRRDLEGSDKLWLISPQQSHFTVSSADTSKIFPQSAQKLGAIIDHVVPM